MPNTFNQLLDTMRGFAAFAICFLVLLTIWSQHYRFFRHYGLQDGPTMALNAVLPELPGAAGTSAVDTGAPERAAREGRGPGEHLTPGEPTLPSNCCHALPRLAIQAVRTSRY